MADSVNPNATNNIAATFLPRLYRTDANKKFIQSTIEQLTQQGTVAKVDGYVGRQNSRATLNSDVFVKAADSTRQHYQLEPSAVIEDKEYNNIFFKDYQDYINQIKVFGGNVDNHTRLNKEEFYSWNPHIDWDKFVNFRQYYWLPEGPTPIRISELKSTIEGYPDYTISDEYMLSNGMVVIVEGISYYVEGVGSSIKLIPTTSLTQPTVSATDIKVGYTYMIKTVDTTDFTVAGAISNDVGQVFVAQDECVGSGTVYLIQPEYILINRASDDLNPWSVINKWVHISVIAASNKINNKSFDFNNALNAKRPIIEFEYNLKLYNYGYRKIYDVTFIDPITEDAFSLVEGSYGYRVDKILLSEGDIVVFTNELDTNIRNNLYTVRFVDSRIHLELLHSPISGEIILVTNGRNNGKYYWYDGVLWGLAQQKTYVNQPPVFDVVDANDVSFGDRTVYTGTSFSGSTIFSYDTSNTSSIDPILGFPVSYKNIGNIGDIVFNFTFGSDTFQYKGYNEVITEDVKNGYLKKTNIDGQFDFYNCWVKSVVENSQPAIRIYKNSSFTDIPETGVVSFTGNTIVDEQQITGLSISVSNLRVGTEVVGSMFATGTLITATNHADNSITLSSEALFTSDNTVLTLGKSTIFNIDIFDDITDLNDLLVRVYIDGIRLPAYTGSEPNWYIVDSIDYKQLILTYKNALASDQILTIKAYAKQPINENGYYEVPVNLQNNPLNETVGKVSLSEVLDHVGSIIDNLDTQFSGDPLGNNNLRDLSDVSSYGTKFVQHSGPASIAFYHMTSSDNNIMSAMEKSSNDYNMFKRAFVRAAETLGIDTDVKTHVDLILQSLNKDTPKTNPYYFSDMAPYTANYKAEYTVYDSDYNIYPLKTAFNLDTLSSTAVGVYVDGVQLLAWHDYTFNDQGCVVISKSLPKDATVEIYEYENTDGCFIPETPTKLGIWPSFDPGIYLDTTLADPVFMIQGHDGSKVVAYNDYRDELILELEKRIYNNIKVKYDPTIFDINNHIPRHNIPNDYSINEFNEIIGQYFFKWTSSLDVDFSKQLGYDFENNFTYNLYGYSFENKEVPGYWRGVYRWLFGTDRPHICPWEMLGFYDKPIWWESVYGPAPYTSDNTVMWFDISEGIINDPSNPTQTQYLRPYLLDHLPVDHDGTLVSPITSGLVQGVATSEIERPYKFGDIGPVEYAWRRSSGYPFAVIMASILMAPAKTLGVLLEKGNVVRNASGEIVNSNTQQRVTLKSIVVPSLYQSESRVQTAGLVNYIVNYNTSEDVQLYNQYKYEIENLNFKLSYRVGGFTSKEKFKLLLDSTTPYTDVVYVPQEDYSLLLNKSSATKKLTYSGVIITKVYDGFVIKGYSKSNPYFTYYPWTLSGKTINVGGISEPFVKWEQDRQYSQGQLVQYNSGYYRAIKLTTSATFNAEDYVLVVNVPVIGGREAIFRKAWDKTSPIKIPYNTKFSTIQEVTDFLLGYGQWLSDQGFVFDDYNSNLNQVANWETSAREFLFWTTQNWSAGEDTWVEWDESLRVQFGSIIRYNGVYYKAIRNVEPSPLFDSTAFVELDGLSTVGSSVISLSPAAYKLTLNTELNVIDSLSNPFNEYEICRVDGQPMLINSLDTTREKTLVSYMPSNDDAIYGASFYLVQHEHVVIIKNNTVFNDLIYEPLSGYKQNRIKVSAHISSDWYGGMDIPGFIYDDIIIQQWGPWRAYTLGDLVEYQSFYYSAKTFISGTEQFDKTKWTRLTDKPESKILPNWTNIATQFTDFYDLDIENFDNSHQTMAHHLIGYQKRSYLSNIIKNDISEFRFFQGMIADKGTKNVFNKLFGILTMHNKGNINVFEEWAVRTGQYGASSAFEEIEFTIDAANIYSNPQSYELVEEVDENLVDYIVQQTPSEIYLPPSGYNSKPWPLLSYNTTYLRSAGYVRESEATHILKTLSEIVGESPSLLSEGDYVWCTFEKTDWNIYRYTRTDIQPSFGRKDDDDPTKLIITASTSATNFVKNFMYIIEDIGEEGNETDFTLIGASDNNIGTTFVATGPGEGTGIASSFIPFGINSYIGLSGIDGINGFYRVVDCENGAFTIHAPSVALPDIETVDYNEYFANLNVFYFTTQRTSSIDLATEILPKYIKTNELMWTDNDGNDKWACWQHDYVYVPASIKNPYKNKQYSYGRSVTVSKNSETLVISSAYGDVYIYKINNGVRSLTQVIEKPFLSHDDINPKSSFGSTVAISEDGEWIAIGSPNISNASSYSSSIRFDSVSDYLDSTTLTFDTTFVSTSSLLTQIGRERVNSNFVHQGTVSIYRKSKNGAYSLMHSYTSPTAQSYEHFGYSLSFSGNTLYVGASGSKYIPAKVYKMDFTIIDHASADFDALNTSGNTLGVSNVTGNIIRGLYVLGYGFNNEQLVLSILDNNRVALDASYDVTPSGRIRFVAYDWVFSTILDQENVMVGYDVYPTVDNPELYCGREFTVSADESMFASSSIKYEFHGTTVAGSNVITGVDGTPSSIFIGQVVVGSSIPSDTTIESINSGANEVTLSNTATLDATSTTFSLGETGKVYVYNNVTNEYLGYVSTGSSTFGHAVSLSDDGRYLVVSDMLASDDNISTTIDYMHQGVVYVYEINEDIEPKIQLFKTIRNRLPEMNGKFGTDLSFMNGDKTLVIYSGYSSDPYGRIDVYDRYYKNWIFSESLSPLSINSGAFIIGNTYTILSLGTTDFTLIGAADNNVGTVFVATGRGTGTGIASYFVGIADIINAGDFIIGNTYIITYTGSEESSTDFTLIGAPNNDIGTVFIATGIGQGTGTAAINLGFSVGNNCIVIGEPTEVDQKLTKTKVRPYENSGLAFEYRKAPNTYSWTILHEQVYKPDLSKIKKVFLYNKSSNTFLTYLDVVDIVQGKLPGPADEELTYKLFYDPATYTLANSLTAGNFVIGQEYIIESLGTTDFTTIGADSNTVGTVFLASGIGDGTGTAVDVQIQVDPGAEWTQEYVGMLWWDLRTTKFIDAYDSDIVYRNNNWQKLAYGAAIDVYEWVESPFLPSRWDELAETPEGLTQNVSGNTLYGDRIYSIKKVFDNISKSEKKTYYFWVKNKTITPNVPGRQISSASVSNLILNPYLNGYKYLSLSSASSFTLSNVTSLFKNKDVVLSVQYWLIDNINQPVHSQWKMISESATTVLPSNIELKWIDSLCGEDEQKRIIPDYALPVKLLYGVENRPRQSMFINRYEALKQYVEYANQVLLRNQITHTRDLTAISTYDEIPPFESNLYDTAIDTESELQLVNADIFSRAVLTPVVTNGRITDVIINDSGYGYKSPPTITVKGDGIDALLFSEIDSVTGRVEKVTIVNGGEGYLSNNTFLTVRGLTVLIKSDSESNGSWAIYTFIESLESWRRIQVKRYDVTRYWSKVDWYADGFSSFTRVDHAVDLLDDITRIDIKNDDIVKVRTSSNGTWTLLLVTDAEKYTYDVIGVQDGTIQLSSDLYNKAGYDGTLYDLTGYDDYPTTELRIILKSIKNNIFINDLASEYMKLFFVAVRYALDEQGYVDWIFKTSFIKAEYNISGFNEPIVYHSDNLKEFEDYIAEVKPYRTKIREYLSTYNTLEDSGITATDFDLPVVTTKGGNTTIDVRIENNSVVSNNPRKLSEYPWKYWADNVGPGVVKIVITNPASGYETPPTVTISGPSGKEAAAYAVIKDGGVSEVIMTHYGSGYLTAPEVTFSTSEFGYTAVGYAVLGKGVIRVNSVGMTFDRTSPTYIYHTNIHSETFLASGVEYPLQWYPSVKKGSYSVYINGELSLSNTYSIVQVSEQISGELYTRKSGKIIFKQPILENAIITVNYKKDITLLNASDRIQFHYNPQIGNIGKDLHQLLNGVDYGGVVIDCVPFELVQGWDSLPYDTDRWGSYDPTFTDVEIPVTNTTTEIEIPYIPTPGTQITIYHKFMLNAQVNVIRIDDIYYGTSKQLNDDALMKTVTIPTETDEYVSISQNGTVTINMPTSFLPKNGDSVILRQTTSDGAYAIFQDDYDTHYYGGNSTYTTASGFIPTDTIIDGDDEFVTPTSNPSTEELVAGNVFDTLSIFVKDEESTIGYQQFKDMVNRNHYKQYDEENITTLLKPFNWGDTEISVTSARHLDDPYPAANKPGVIQVGSERIEYFYMKDNVLSQLRRATLGTGATMTYPVGTEVLNLGYSQTINYTDRTIVKRILIETSTNLIDLDFVPMENKVVNRDNWVYDTSGFVSNIPTEYGQCDDIEVFVGGYNIKEWASKNLYEVGDIISYNSSLYKVIIKHESGEMFVDNVNELDGNNDVISSVSYNSVLVFFSGHLRMRKVPYSIHDPNISKYSPAGDVQFDADFTVDGISTQIRFTNPLPINTTITVIKRVGQNWYNQTMI